MLPRDPNDGKDIFIEVRAGAGGDEAGIFAGDLLRMYSRYAEGRKMRVELLSESENEAGGYKEVVDRGQGRRAVPVLQVRERRASRAARAGRPRRRGACTPRPRRSRCCPKSTKTTRTCRSIPKTSRSTRSKPSGAGGQHVNKTESAIRITHVPSGIIVSCSEERSQLQNRERAMGMLRAQLAERKRREAEEAVGSLRRSQVGTGDRSEKIRTYNYPQDRITDHRINQNFQNIKAILDGDMDRLVTELQRDERARLLAGETPAA